MGMGEALGPNGIQFDERVSIGVDGHVAHVELTRPAKLNALDLRSFEAIAKATSWLLERREIRAVVLSGRGGGFCSGMDLDDVDWLFAEEGRTRLTDRRFGDANLFQWCALAWRELPMPVVAALHGPVIGGGLQLALGADMRYCAPDARMSLREVRWGTIPDMAATVLLPELVRADVFRDILFSARVFDGEEARSLGIATQVCADPLAEALKTADALSAMSPSALRAAKRLANSMSGRTRADALSAEVDEQLELLGGSDHHETLSAFREKRAPSYDMVVENADERT